MADIIQKSRTNMRANRVVFLKAGSVRWLPRVVKFLKTNKALNIAKPHADHRIDNTGCPGAIILYTIVSYTRAHVS